MKTLPKASFAWLACLALAACHQPLTLTNSDEPMDGDVTVKAQLELADPNAPYRPVEGDIIFQSLPRNPLIDAIEGASDSPFSHCGILHQDNGAWLVIEAIGPVKETPLEAWIVQGREQRYAVFRLKQPYRAKIPTFVEAAQGYKGLPYDIHYDLDDAAIYCSEIIYKSFLKVSGEEMGRLQKLGDLRWQPHVAVIKQIEGGNVPLERKMITPRSLSEATQIEKVFSNWP